LPNPVLSVLPHGFSLSEGLYLLAFSLWSLQICYASRLPFGSLRSALTRKFCKQVVIGGQKIEARKEVEDCMAKYTIIRVYEVPADTKQQATDRMIEAMAFNVEKDFHVKDIIREPDAKPGEGKVVSLKPPAGWLDLLRKQLTGQ